jgi:hypothetical protein
MDGPMDDLGFVDFVSIATGWSVERASAFARDSAVPSVDD